MMRVTLPDGLYRVITGCFVAGFLVRGGVVTHCAPILRARLVEHWAERAQWVWP